ncbi:MAG: hypothetical protein HY653_06770 [Acidobacteria bacterium]|nr:hypothetical protein [Acidobacteriota bacterium]
MPVGLGLVGVALAGVFLWLRRFEPFDQHVPEVVGVGLLAGALYLLGVFLILRPRASDSRLSLGVVLVGALTFRLILLGAAPTLSDDLYRYQWEGRVQAAGWNPYRVVPDDPEVAGLRDASYPRVSGQHVPPAYPPLAELYFYALARAGKLAAFKWAALGLDLATLGIVLLLLRIRGEPLVRALVYGWCPLVVLEFAGHGHYDALVLATLLLAILLIIRKQRGASMAALAAAALAKWFGLLALPAFATRTGWRWVSVFAGTSLLISWPYLDAGRELVSGLVAYGEQWRNNESLFALLRWVTQRDDVAAGLALGVVVGLMVYAAQARVEPLQACYWLVGAILLLSPSVFPWYVTWLVPFLCFFPHRAALLFTVTVLLSYHVVIGYRILGVWEYDRGLVLLEYLPVYGLLLWGVMKSRLSGGGSWRARPALSPPS